MIGSDLFHIGQDISHVFDAGQLLGLASREIAPVIFPGELGQREQRDPDAVVDGSCQSLLEDNTARGDVSCLKIVQSHLVRSLAIFVFVRCVFVVKLAERFLIKNKNEKFI